MSPFQTIQSGAAYPNLPAADVDAHLDVHLHVDAHRRDVHLQQAHTSAHVQTPPPTLKML